jgi:hypothetical protein
MTPLIDLYRKVSAAWPEMKQPVDYQAHPESKCPPAFIRHHTSGFVHDVDEPTARIICAAVWAEEAMRIRGADFKGSDKGIVSTMLPYASASGSNTYATGPDLCECAANALCELAKEK